MTTTPPTPTSAAPAADRTELWGWLGIILGALCCGVFGIGFGILSLRSAGRAGKSATLGWAAVTAGILNVLYNGFALVTRTGPFG